MTKVSRLSFLKAFDHKFPNQQPPYLCQIALNEPPRLDMTFNIMDLYCDNLSCHCHKVTLIACANNKTWATFDYGWESYAFYRQSGLDPQVAAMTIAGFPDLTGPQSIYTDILTDCFFQLIADQQLVDRIKQRYHQFRAGSNVINLKDKTRKYRNRN